MQHPEAGAAYAVICLLTALLIFARSKKWL